MTNIPTQLEVGYIPATKDEIYEVPVGFKLLLSQIRYGINVNSTAEDVKFYLNIGAVSYRIIQATLEADERGLETEMGNILNAGDKIEAETTTADMVPFFIFGALVAVTP